MKTVLFLGELNTLDEFIKVNFVRNDENDADLFTKKLSGDKYKMYSDKFTVNKGTVKVVFKAFNRLHNKKVLRWTRQYLSVLN